MQKKNKKILLSGVKPTGIPHIGNYFGAMKQFVDMQDEYDSYIFLANYHALTQVNDKNKLSKSSYNLVLDYLGIGLDPEKITLFKQSSVPQVTELAWIFSCLISVPMLMQAHAYKDAEANRETVNAGVFNYPVLMAADILIYDADIVPVGKDQRQHVEYAREIARKFNSTFGKTFIVPKEFVIENVETVPGTDGQKMSKSYGNTIPLFGTDKEIEKAVMSIVTDSRGVDDPKDPEKCNIFAMHKLVISKNQLEELREKYKKGEIGYGDSKKILLENLLSYFAPMKERRKKYEKDPELVAKILRDGGEKAQERAEAKMKIVREKVGLL